MFRLGDDIFSFRFWNRIRLLDLCDSLQTPSLRIDFHAYQLNKNLHVPFRTKTSAWK